jgi:hypothetical protein
MHPWKTPSVVYGRFEEHEVVADYRQLLRRGSVMRRLAVSQHALWRQAIRARARIDELRVRTWSRNDQPASVWAVLQDWSPTREEHEQLQQRLAWLRED